MCVRSEASHAFRSKYETQCTPDAISERPAEAVPSRERLERCSALIDDLVDFYGSGLGQVGIDIAVLHKADATAVDLNAKTAGCD